MVIHPMMYNTGTSIGPTDCSSDDIAYGVTYYVEPAEEELPLIQAKRVWPVMVATKPQIAFIEKFIRRFRGNNRGRHWDRKRL